VGVYLFDFNGVLVDDERVHFAAFRDVIAAHGVTLDEATYVARYFAFDDATAFRNMLTDAGKVANPAIVASCVAAKLPLYLAAVERELVLFEGAFELLRACAARGPVAIVSGALRAEIDFALARAGATGNVRENVAAEDVELCKPDPAGYLAALGRLGVSARDAVVIEDSIGGIDAGHAAGCPVVAVAHSYPAAQLQAAGAELVVPRIGVLDVAQLDAVRARRIDA
jgi:HAD superfamily hydrolase (TIGR01509 family)